MAKKPVLSNRGIAGFALTLAILVLASVSAAAQSVYPDASRIVSVGGTVTEIIHALGAGDRIVAVDTTSTFPPEAAAKPNVGYMRQLSAEGVLAQTPDLIIAEEGAGPAEALAILKDSAIPLVTIPTPPQASAVAAKIRAIGQTIGKTAEAEILANAVDEKFTALAGDISTIDAPKKRVLFALSLANGRIMAAGAGTSADAIIELAGGINAAASISGYKPLSDEAVMATAPEVLLVMDNASMHIGPDEAFALPALSSSPAARDGALIAMDGLYLLGFGPRTPDAARELAGKLYPGAPKP